MIRRTSAHLSPVLLPLYASSRIQAGSFAIGGRFSQMASNRSASADTNAFFFAAISSNLAPQRALTTRPSNPTVSPCLSTFSIYSFTVGTPSSPMRYKVMVVPSNCLAACTKYLPSVQSPASVIVITAVPADPVNPVIYVLAIKYSPTYSDS